MCPRPSCTERRIPKPRQAALGQILQVASIHSDSILCVNASAACPLTVVVARPLVGGVGQLTYTFACKWQSWRRASCFRPGPHPDNGTRRLFLTNGGVYRVKVHEIHPSQCCRPGLTGPSCRGRRLDVVVSMRASDEGISRLRLVRYAVTGLAYLHTSQLDLGVNLN